MRNRSSFRRAAVIAGVAALFASAMTPAHAGTLPGKPVAKKKVPDTAKAQQPAGRGGGNVSLLSLQWMLGASLRP